jgi:hypothetical protein
VCQNCLPREKREDLGKCDNEPFLKKKVSSENQQEIKHPKLDESKLSTIKVG